VTSRAAIPMIAGLLTAIWSCTAIVGVGEYRAGDGGSHDAGQDDGTASHDASTGPDTSSARDTSTQTCSGNCVPGAAKGWSGPYEVYFGSVTQSAPTCSTSYTSVYSGHDTLNAPSAECPCSCGTPACAGTANVTWGCGTSCSAANPVSFTGGTCYTVGDSTETCSSTDPFWYEGSVGSTTGSCAPIAKLTAAPPSWENFSIGCKPTATGLGTCDASGDVCLPPVTSASSHMACIEVQGNMPCPSGSAYSNQHIEYDSWSDTRACPSGCLCYVPTGLVCSATMQVYSSSTCTGNSAVSSLDGSGCYVTTVGTGTEEVVLSATSGSCASITASVQPTGSVTPSTPTTFCCLP
jgi:hypothetical protein